MITKNDFNDYLVSDLTMNMCVAEFASSHTKTELKRCVSKVYDDALLLLNSELESDYLLSPHLTNLINASMQAMLILKIKNCPCELIDEYMGKLEVSILIYLGSEGQLDLTEN